MSLNNEMDKDIQKIIEWGALAPSGENCQPWRFRVRGSEIEVFNLPERDYSLYSWGQRASMIAHGALLENMSVAASTLGYRTSIDLLPHPERLDFTARVRLSTADKKDDTLAEAIEQRTTNRKIYKPGHLNTTQEREILKSTQEVGRGRVVLIQDREKIARFAPLASVNEKILFENHFLHSFFFDHITWTKEEDDQKKIGFYIETLELPPPAKAGFKLFKNWNLLKLFNRVGLSKMVAKENAKTYASASAIGAIVIDSNSAEEYLWAGRLMERVWLKATKEGLSLQPLTGILFLMQRILGGEVKELAPEHQKLVTATYEEIKNIFGIEHETIAMCFRVGHSDPPTARSKRLIPEIVWE